MSEADVGGELTVDHHQPPTAGGDDSLSNLVYACPRCNGYKGPFFPGVGDLAHGRRVLHPREDDLSEHIRENERTGHLDALTETGRFHVALLQLNRPALVEHRLRARMAALLAAKLRLLEDENDQLRATIVAQETYLRGLRRLPGGAVDALGDAGDGDPRRDE